MNKETIQTKLLKPTDEEKNDTIFAVHLASCILGIIGCYGIIGLGFYSNHPTSDFPQYIYFYSILILQSLVTIFHHLGLIPFGLWDWIK